MNRADRILSVAVVLFALLIGPAVKGATAMLPATVVTVDSPSGSTSVPLSVDRTLHVEGALGEVKVVVRDGSAWVEDSSCPDHVCVMRGAVSASGEAIACVPNHVFITIGGERTDGLDAVIR